MVPAALNAWRQEVGGSIYADAPSAVTSAVAIVHQISTPQSTARPPVTRLSQVSSQESTGSMITAAANFCPVRNWPLRIRTHWINPRPDPPDGYPLIGKNCSTNRGLSHAYRVDQARLRSGLDPTRPRVVLKKALEQHHRWPLMSVGGDPLLVKRRLGRGTKRRSEIKISDHPGERVAQKLSNRFCGRLFFVVQRNFSDWPLLWSRDGTG